MGTKPASELETGDTIVREGNEWTVRDVYRADPDATLTVSVYPVGGPNEEVQFKYDPSTEVRVE